MGGMLWNSKEPLRAKVVANGGKDDVEMTLRPESRTRAYQEINRLIDEGERILDACSLENFMKNGGADARKDSITQWLTKAEAQIADFVENPNDAITFSVDGFNRALQALHPQPPSAAQLRSAFVEIVQEKLLLLNALIGREA